MAGSKNNCKQPYSFVLADGAAPFEVLGTVELAIKFSNSITHINGHIARNLCTDMIIGMDYINKYNLNINVKKQIVSIDYKNHIYVMLIDKHFKSIKIPVSSSKPLFIPPNSFRTTQVSIPVSSICSSFFPQFHLPHNKFISVIDKHLKFQNYCCNVVFSNISSYPQSLRQGICVGYLVCNPMFQYSRVFTSSPHKSFGAVSYSDAIPARYGLKVDDAANDDSYIASKAFLQNRNEVRSSQKDIGCNTIQAVSPVIVEHINMLVNKIENNKQKDDLFTLLMHFHASFDTTTHNIARTYIHHVINTISHSPPASRPYPQPDKEEAMYKLVQEFLQAGLVTESHSPYAAPAMLVKKSDGSKRFVVDYTKLNLVTIRDSSPLPNMEETIMKLGKGFSYFSKLDLKSGFYQIPIRESDKKKTAFVTPFGLYQFNVLPMGLRNSPPTFQKVMTNALQFCRPFSLVYLDDIVVFSKSFSEHLHHLQQVFSALEAQNLVLNPAKCELAARQIDYLGHTISQNRIAPTKDKIAAILQIGEPRTLPQANNFIGALGWYRKFLPKFAAIAAPIHAITNLTKRSRSKFRWRLEQSEAFKQLKRMLTTEPLFLHYPVDNQPLILTTDASGIGLGGVLQQEIDGELHNLYYHSQVMTPCERKYSTIEKEALAIYKCCTRMRSYLLGRSIIIMTDHCPLCYIMQKSIKNARVNRITHLIQEYNIEKVIHIQGRNNCLPDYLSRYSREQDDDLFNVEYGLASKDDPVLTTSTSNDKKLIPPTTVSSSKHNILAAITLRPRKNKPELNNNPTSVDNKNTTDDEVNSESIQNDSQVKQISSEFSQNYFDINKLKFEQDGDPDIQTIIKNLCSPPHQLSFVLIEKILYKLIALEKNTSLTAKVIYLPSSMINSLLRACHDDPMTGAHFSTDRTYYKIRNHFWWPQMKSTIQRYIKACRLCTQYNISRHKKYGQLRPISPPEGPFTLVGIDYCGPFKQTPRENQYVLVITDYFTRHITAIALPNCTAQTTAQALFNEFFCKYGIPSVILSDQGSHFQNQLMGNIKKLIGYNHIYSTPYHPQTNGVVERFNATFVPQISKLQDTQNNNWDEFLQAVVFAYNTGAHKTTKFSPYELLYGRSPRLPIYTRPTQFSFNKPNDYFEQLKKTLRIYHQASIDNILQQQQVTKTWYDRHRLNPQLKIGNKVLTRIYGLRGKLEPKFSPIPKVIVQVRHPVYIVEDEQTHITSQVHVSDLRPILTE
ncbi:unnamed protein product [Rotaria magnacalcarata]|uniref:RNA-directed DNA polymerase n=3 Tax=Rotaria magnacalcarata TaxID=392030 RepID=A0A819ZZ12_9BILA|nr:unnamed protein product [Rotaria magnacalcarata]CAF4181589.1 unnamed protein product [Rotaria magnacalcarata]